MRFLLLALMIALCGCSPSPSPSPDDDYCPLALGQEAISTMTIIYPDGKMIEGILRDTIESEVVRDGKTYFRNRELTEGVPNGLNYTELLRKDEKAKYSIDERTRNAVEQIDDLLPFKVGSTWQHTVNGNRLTLSVIEQSKVEVSGKTYDNCFRIHVVSADDRTVEDVWRAPHFGVVKVEVAYGNGVQMTVALKEFKPGK